MSIKNLVKSFWEKVKQKISKESFDNNLEKLQALEGKVDSALSALKVVSEKVKKDKNTGA